MKNIYLIRHAPTLANLKGEMVWGYNDMPILDSFTDKMANQWYSKIGKHLPSGEFKLFNAPNRRCRQTAEILFPVVSTFHTIRDLPEVKEFDCSSIGDRNFWELSKIEFESLICFSHFDMMKQAKAFLKVCKLSRYDNIVVISSGMFIRYLYHFLHGNETITPYEVINSVGFKFNPLDMMHVNLDTLEINVYRNT